MVLEGERLLWDDRTGSIHLLNETAGVIWDALVEEPATVDEVAAMLAEAFPSQRDEVRREVVATVVRFVDQGLLDVGA